MDFMTGLLSTPRGFDVIWGNFHRLTKSTHFIPINTSFLLHKLVEIYIRVVMKLHGVTLSIVMIETHSLHPDFWEVCRKIWVLSRACVLLIIRILMVRQKELFSH